MSEKPLGDAQADTADGKIITLIGYIRLGLLTPEQRNRGVEALSEEELQRAEDEFDQMRRDETQRVISSPYQL